MKEIKNEKESVKKGRCMNEEDILNDILLCEKNISNNYSVACNEMSNKCLFKIILDILNDTKNITRELFNLAFEKGWYTICAENETEIQKAYNEYQKKISELS